MFNVLNCKSEITFKNLSGMYVSMGNYVGTNGIKYILPPGETTMTILYSTTNKWFYTPATSNYSAFVQTSTNLSDGDVVIIGAVVDNSLVPLYIKQYIGKSSSYYYMQGASLSIVLGLPFLLIYWIMSNKSQI